MRSLAIAASLFAISCTSHRHAGVRDAERDFAKGTMQIETYGLGGPMNPYEEHLLKNGIKINSVAGCMVDKEILKHAEGYNLTMKRLINQRLGRDIFKEAEEYSKAQNAPKSPENN